MTRIFIDIETYSPDRPRLRRKISTSGKRPALYIPEDVMRATQVKPGDDVDIYTEGRRIIIEPVSEPED